MKTARVPALILAAGRSSRMPDHKLLLEIEGEPLVRRVALAALASRASSVVAVVGHREADVRAALDGLPLAVISNPAHERGLSSSVATGIGGLGEDVDGALVCLGDMPFVRTSDLDTAIAAFSESGGSNIVIPTYQERRGNPVLWPCDLFGKLSRLEGDMGGRELFREHLDRVQYVRAEHSGVLTDIDTAEDAARHSLRLRV